MMIFKNIVRMCFGWALLSCYTQSIAKIRSLFEAIEPLRAFTAKVHIVFEYTTDICEQAGRSLCIS